MRELYIVQSLHTTIQYKDQRGIDHLIEGGMTPKEIQAIARAAELQERVRNQIIKAIAKEEGSDSLFFEMIDECMARYANTIARDQRLLKKVEDETEINDGDPTLSNFKLFQACYQITQGNIKIYKTEPETVVQHAHKDGYPNCLCPTVKWGFEYGLINEKDKEGRRVEKESIRYEKRKDNVEAYINALTTAWLLIRDRAIFRNIKKYGGEKSILFMGYAHELRDFDERECGFNVVRVCLYQKGLNSFIRRGRGLKLNDTLEYRINVTNRETVPEGIREIIEQNIARARE